MKAKKSKSLKPGLSSNKKSIKHNAANGFKAKKQKAKKLHKMSELPASKSVVPVEVSGRVTEVLSQIHQLQAGRPAAQPVPPSADPASSPTLPPAASPPPLKKPRAERTAYLPPPPPATDDGDPRPGDDAPSQPAAARGKKKRRKVKLAKRKLRREELQAAAGSPKSKLESARFRLVLSVRLTVQYVSACTVL